ncbi:MAG TPA: hypothetical protein VF611_12795, partial [Pyrinomonadaceae bacterium]
MPDEQPTESTRDRVRALVREVLKNAAPAEDEADDAPPPAAAGPRQRTEASDPPLARVVDVAPPAAVTRAEPEKDYARDESSKTVITEDDVRGLPEGARLRVAESARLTPLAADIV